MGKHNNIPKLRFSAFDGEWEEKTLGEVSSFYNGKAFKQEELLDTGKYPVLRVGNLFTSDKWYYSNLELEENKLIDLGDLIFAWSASFGPRIWQGHRVIYHYHIWKVVENPTFLHRMFYYWVLENETLKMKSNSSNGFALLHITKGTIENWNSFFPTLPEQTKIADFLSDVDEKLQTLKQKKTALETYKKGLMQKLFSQALRFKDADGKDFPDWEEKFGNEVFESISDRNHNSDLPILAITQEHGAIPRDLIDFEISVTDKSVESYKVVNVGDFIISLRSFQGGIEYSTYKGICSPAYIILRPVTAIDDRFYKFYLKTDRYIAELQKNLEGIRDGKMISFKYFSAISLPFPSLAEQTKIADFLSRIDEKIAVTALALEKMEVWKKGLLQKMFV